MKLVINKSGIAYSITVVVAVVYWVMFEGSLYFNYVVYLAILMTGAFIAYRCHLQEQRTKPWL